MLISTIYEGVPYSNLWYVGEGVACCEREMGGKATSVSDNYSPEGVRNVGILR